MIEILQPHVVASVDELARRFRSGEPFPHVVIDGLLREDVVESLLQDFPSFERGESQNEAGLPGLKSSFEPIRELGEGFAHVDDLVRDPEFLGLLSRLTGIDGLLYDPDYVGGGAHQNRAGQGLDPHVDFNYHPTTAWHRRLNLLLYLNPEWREEWGGCLELHSDAWRPAEDRVTSVLPLLNRCVLFETSERSWHGFLPITPTSERPDLSRRSLALYFYTRERPAAESAPPHATVYVDRPLPALAADRALCGAEVAEVHRLTARRQQHAERLFRREQQLVSRVRERLARALGPGSPPGPGALEALGRLVKCQDEAVRSLYSREQELATLLTLPESSGATPVSLGEALSLAAPVEGCWDDGWVGRRLRLRVRTSCDVSGIVVRGALPRAAGPAQELSLSVQGQVAVRRLGVGDFEWSVASLLPAGAVVEIGIDASLAYCPKAAGVSDDERELAWLLVAIGAKPK